MKQIIYNLAHGGAIIIIGLTALYLMIFIMYCYLHNMLWSNLAIAPVVGLLIMLVTVFLYVQKPDTGYFWIPFIGVVIFFGMYVLPFAYDLAGRPGDMHARAEEEKLDKRLAELDKNLAEKERIENSKKQGDTADVVALFANKDFAQVSCLLETEFAVSKESIAGKTISCGHNLYDESKSYCQQKKVYNQVVLLDKTNVPKLFELYHLKEITGINLYFEHNKLQQLIYTSNGLSKEQAQVVFDQAKILKLVPSLSQEALSLGDATNNRIFIFSVSFFEHLGDGELEPCKHV